MEGSRCPSPSAVVSVLASPWNVLALPVFNSCNAFRSYRAHLDDIYKDFTHYKFRVPVSGAIILDDTHDRCLLVKGWKSSASWSFPRGKRSKDEEDHTCAIREYLEETGCDVSKLLKLDDHMEVSIGQQRVRLYIIAGVKEDTVFAPQTKEEISEISWHRIDDLLPASDDAISRGVNGMKLYMVAPFLKGLKAWIGAHCQPVYQKPDTSRGTVWKAKNPSGVSVPVENYVITICSPLRSIRSTFSLTCIVVPYYDDIPVNTNTIFFSKNL